MNSLLPRLTLRTATLAIALATLLNPVSSALAEKPLALHPDNPHYFLFRGKPTILITSGEHYGAVLNLDFDYVPYLKELQSHELNHTRTFAGTYREIPSSFGITENTLAPKPGRYIAPWARSDVPGCADGGNKFDLTKWDEAYFKRLKDFLSQASKRGVVVEMNLFCPFYEEALWELDPMNDRNNINGVGKCTKTQVYDLSHPDVTAVQNAVTAKIVETLKDFDNLYYEICNEPWFGNVTTQWQAEIAATIVKTESAYPARHLISQNILKQKITNPNPAVSIYNFHYAAPPEVIGLNYGLNLALGDNETGFRGKENVCYRTEAWDCFIAGGALYSSLDYSFTASHPSGTLLQYDSPGGGNVELRKQLRIVRNFMDDLDFVRMSPMDSLIKGGIPTGLMTGRALVEKGKTYAIYVRHRTNADRFHARWTGSLVWPTNGAVTLHLTSAQGARLWLDDKLVVDNSKTHEKKEDTAEVSFPAGTKVPVRLELYQGRVGSVLQMSWTTPGGKKEVIPTSQFIPAGGEGQGLKADYYDDRSMKNLVITRNDSVIDFDWTKNDPFMDNKPAPSVNLTLDLPAGSYRASWVDTMTGKIAKKENFKHAGGHATLASPDFAEDIALKITVR